MGILVNRKILMTKTILFSTLTIIIGLLAIAVHIQNATEAFTHSRIPIIIPVPIHKSPTLSECLKNA